MDHMLFTVGDRVFSVAVSRLWNSLPPVVTSAPTPTVFHNRLNTYLFPDHFPHSCCLHLVLYTVHTVV